MFCSLSPLVKYSVIFSIWRRGGEMLLWVMWVDRWGFSCEFINGSLVLFEVLQVWLVWNETSVEPVHRLNVTDLLQRAERCSLSAPCRRSLKVFNIWYPWRGPLQFLRRNKTLFLFFFLGKLTLVANQTTVFWITITVGIYTYIRRSYLVT